MSSAAAGARSRNLPARIQRRLRTLYARTRHRFGLRSAGPGSATIDPRFRHPIDATRKSILVEQYRNLFPQSVALESAEASRLAQHIFTFVGHTMQHGERIAWSRDPISSREWPRGFSPDIPYRGPERTGDIKLPWELNKHQYFFTLGKVAWLSGDGASAVEIVKQIDHWIDDNPYLAGINWISALEAGTRAVSWMLSYPFYADVCDAPFRRRLTESLAQHLLFVEQHLSDGPFANTHLVGEAAALVGGGLFLDSPHSARWLARGLEVLERQIGLQVTTDGLHAERSVAYHRFFLDHYYLVAGLLRANGRSFGQPTLERMEQMTDVLMHVLFPDRTAPAFGDGDDARGLWVRADSPSDYRGLLAMGAVLFGREDFKAAAAHVTEEVFWLQGLDGVVTFEALAQRLPADTSVAYPNAGYYVMRAGWGASDAVLVFDCGPLGFGPAGHGHADALSFQLHAAGYPFLVDAGTFSYNLDYEWRDLFRGTRAHNTIVVDGEDQSVPRDRMSWKTVARSYAREWVSTPWFDLADGEHDGYARLSDPVTHRRAIVFLKPDVCVIWDTLEAIKDHHVEFLLHVRPDCAVEVAPGAAGALLTSPEGHRLSVWISANGGTGGFEVVMGNEGERAGWFSPGYGTRVPSRVLRATREMRGQASLVTCLSLHAATPPVVTERTAALEVCVPRGEGSEDRLYYSPNAGQTFEGEGVRFDGTLLFRRTTVGRPDAVRARRFRELSLPGLLEVRAPAVIDHLTLEEHHCDITIDTRHASELHFRLREGVRVVVNGPATPPDPQGTMT